MWLVVSEFQETSIETWLLQHCGNPWTSKVTGQSTLSSTIVEYTKLGQFVIIHISKTINYIGMNILKLNRKSWMGNSVVTFTYLESLTQEIFVVFEIWIITNWPNLVYSTIVLLRVDCPVTLEVHGLPQCCNNQVSIDVSWNSDTTSHMLSF